jgi:hypothetical protein
MKPWEYMVFESLKKNDPRLIFQKFVVTLQAGIFFPRFYLIDMLVV